MHNFTASITVGSKSSACSFDRMSFSAPPTSPDCVVFGLVDRFENSVHISFIRRGDSSWTWYGSKGLRNRLKSKLSKLVVPFAWPNYRSPPVFHNGCFYSLGRDGMLGVFNPKAEKEIDMWGILDTPQHNAFMFDNYFEAYLMESPSPHKELMSVVVGSKGKPIRIVKFNHTLKKWKTVTCLEDQAVFLSHVSCIVVDCKELHVKGLQNTVHFPRFRGDYNVFYSLSSKKFHTSYASKDLCDTRLPMNVTWMVPDFQLFSDQQLDWLLSDPRKSICEEEDLVDRIDFFQYQTFTLPSNPKSIVMGGGGEDATSAAAAGRKPWIIYSCEIEEEEVNMFVDLSTGMSYKRDIVEERLRGKKTVACNDGRVFLMNTKDGDCIILDASTMTIYPFPTFEDVCYFQIHFCLLYLSPQDNKIVVVMFGSIDKRDADGKGGWADDLAFTSRVATMNGRYSRGVLMFSMLHFTRDGCGDDEVRRVARSWQ
ncbi:hypothetical protein LINGRAHAP2_LOCUS9574 [Linum grandiflorum]